MEILNDGSVTKERLAFYERKIIDELVNNYGIDVRDFENYLNILKSVHCSTDLIMTYNFCSEFIDDLCYQMDVIINNIENEDILKLEKNYKMLLMVH